MIISLAARREVWRRELEDMILDCYRDLQRRRAQGERIPGVAKDADGDWAVWPEAIEKELKRFPRFRFASEAEVWAAIHRLTQREDLKDVIAPAAHDRA